MGNMIQKDISKNLVNSIYLHSSKWNFYDSASNLDFGNRKDWDKDGNPRIRQIFDSTEQLKENSLTLEKQFYNDLKTIGLDIEKFQALFKQGQRDFSSEESSQLTDTDIKILIGKRLNNEYIMNLLQGSYGQLNTKTIQKKLTGKVEENMIEEFIQAVNIGNTSGEFVKAIETYINGDKTKLEPFKILLGDKNTKKRLYGVASSTIAKNIRELKNSDLYKDTAFKRGLPTKIDEYIKGVCEKVFSELKLNDKKRQQRIIFEVQEAYKNAIKQVSGKIKIRDSKEKFAITGDVLEYQITYQLGLINGLDFNVLAKKEENRTLYNIYKKRGDENFFIKGGPSRVDFEIKINNHYYGIQAKNTLANTDSTMHLQSEMLLDTLLTTLAKYNQITSEDQQELYYLLINTFFLQNQPDKANKLGVNASGISEANVVSYANLLIQQGLSYALQDQSVHNRGSEVFDIFLNDGHNTRVGNAFILFKDRLIPMSVIYDSLLQYINQIAGGNLKDTRGFGMARVSSSSKNLPMFKKILIDSKDKKSMYQEKQDYLESKEGQNNLVKGQFVYPQGLLNIGSKYGQELAGSIKIKGISLYANFKALDKILNDNINNNKN